MTALLRCTGLARRPWFEGFDLELAPGEIAVLRGATGSGKTLCMRALADLDPADEGELSLDGRSREEHTPVEWHRGILFVHPTAPVLPGTVASNLAAIPSGAAEPTPTLGPLGALDRDANAERLSSGERQLLAFERALRADPRVLLFDEGTAHLDAERARGVESALRAWVESGSSCLWASHDAELAGRVGAREVAFP